MFKLKLKIPQLICFVVSLLLLGCDEDKRETPSSVSVYRILKDDTGNYSYLSAAIDRAGMRSFFESNERDFTIFAPINQAFIDAGFPNLLSVKTADPVVLEKILKYHIIENKILVKPIAGEVTVTALDGNEITLDRIKILIRTGEISVFFANGADILSRDVNGTNGNVQTINKVLVPKTNKNIMNILAENSNYSLFLAAINRASLGSRNYAAELASSSQFTVFAPVNAAFAEFMGGKYNSTTSINNTPPQTVADELVGNHIINNAYFTYKLPFISLSLNSSRLTISKTFTYNAPNAIAGYNTVVNGGAVTRSLANAMATNGFVNGVGAVFALPSSLTLSDAARANSNLTFFVAAVDRASTGGVDFSGMLSGTSDYTIFAPSNQAFRDEGYETIDVVNTASPSILIQLLSKHFFEGSFYSNSYPVGTFNLLSIGGTDVEFDNTTLYTAKGPLNTAPGTISTRNEIRKNGVLNIINQVIK
ncbi:fasciclin domain-containing protein [Flavobacterium sp. UMI-01]|uniref:fasciclin domain-containing protein n=1 Tax=Flavobacterium sp. UMI-01 TaxID=1441053 RepID=UPI001C7CA6C3|nr:fasciclin domain-containing protein [Flavobacterium sp. UMI-01]GIZ08783.1 hypothetical protein FUMI01_15100 [Flavobacterium sp. UMI-01]